jgi:hypothetical protein
MALSPLTLQLLPRQSVLLPEEPDEFLLLLANPSSEDVTTPLPASDWWSGASFLLTSSDGFSHRFQLPVAPSRASEPRLVLFDDSDREYSFTLRGRLPPLPPGEYSLQGTLPTGREEWSIPSTTFWVAETGVPLVAILPAPPWADAFEFWTILPSERRTALFFRRFAPGAGHDGTQFQSLPPEAVLNLPSGACSPAAGFESGTPAAPPRRWVAWLEADALGAGCGLFPFYRGSLPLPGPAAELLPHLVPTPAGMLAFVLSAHRRSLWQFLLPSPEPISPEANLESFDPLPLPPLTLGPIRNLPVAPASIAVTTALVLLSVVEDSLELQFSPLACPPVWTRTRIARASCLDGCRLSLQTDAFGVTRVGVAFLERENGPALGLAVVAYDREGQPLWVDGAGRWRFPLPEAPRYATCAIRYETGTGNWLVDWVAILKNGDCWLRHGDMPPCRLDPDGRVLTPLLLASSDEIAGVACLSPDGLLELKAPPPY